MEMKINNWYYFNDKFFRLTRIESFLIDEYYSDFFICNNEIVRNEILICNSLDQFIIPITTTDVLNYLFDGELPAIWC